MLIYYFLPIYCKATYPTNSLPGFNIHVISTGNTSLHLGVFFVVFGRMILTFDKLFNVTFHFPHYFLTIHFRDLLTPEIDFVKGRFLPWFFYFPSFELLIHFPISSSEFQPFVSSPLMLIQQFQHWNINSFHRKHKHWDIFQISLTCQPISMSREPLTKW